MTTERIILPSHLNAATLMRVAESWPDDASEVIVDFSGQIYVYPSGTAGLSCLVKLAIDCGQKVCFEVVGCSNIWYWQRMQFFRNFGVPRNRSAGRQRTSAGRFSEIQPIEDIEKVDDLTSDLVRVAAPNEDAQRIFSHVVSEALNNVCQHSEYIGYCASQYYEGSSRGMVRFCIADAGIGLKESLKNSYRPKDDITAVLKALEVGVTGRSRAAQLAVPRHMRNRGVGLSAILKLVQGNHGSLTLWSGNARYQCSAFGAGVKESPYWQGTFLAVEMPRREISARFGDIMRELTAELRVIESGRARRRRRRPNR